MALRKPKTTRIYIYKLCGDWWLSNNNDERIKIPTYKDIQILKSTSKYSN